jgi:hypothetical protein
MKYNKRSADSKKDKREEELPGIYLGKCTLVARVRRLISEITS